MFYGLMVYALVFVMFYFLFAGKVQKWLMSREGDVEEIEELDEAELEEVSSDELWGSSVERYEEMVCEVSNIRGEMSLLSPGKEFFQLNQALFLWAERLDALADKMYLLGMDAALVEVLRADAVEWRRQARNNNFLRFGGEKRVTGDEDSEEVDGASCPDP